MKLTEAQWASLEEIERSMGGQDFPHEEELADLGLVRLGFVVTHLTEKGEQALAGRRALAEREG